MTEIETYSYYDDVGTVEAETHITTNDGTELIVVEYDYVNKHRVFEKQEGEENPQRID